MKDLKNIFYKSIILILPILIFNCAVSKKTQNVIIIGEAVNYKAGAVVVSDKNQNRYFLDGISSWDHDISSWIEGGENQQVKVSGILLVTKLKPIPKGREVSSAHIVGIKKTIMNPKWEVVYNERSNDKILKGLDLSYVTFSEDSVLKEYLRVNNISNDRYLRDKKTYHKCLEYFFDADINIVTYLLGFEKDIEYCTWVEPLDPFSSSLDPNFDKTTSALILIDNYLTPHKKEITIRKTNISYRKIRRFIENNKKLDLESLRQVYWGKFGD